MSEIRSVPKKRIRILGVDPGSRLTGYGCVDWNGREVIHVGHGVLRLTKGGTESEMRFEVRLKVLFENLNQLIEEWRPDCLVVEKVFFAKNANSALKLGQARGVILVVGALKDLPIVEYNPTEIKAAISGYGRAEKQQMADSLRLQLKGLEAFETHDASDALALAFGHARSLGWLGARNPLTAVTSSRRRRRLSDLVQK